MYELVPVIWPPLQVKPFDSGEAREILARQLGQPLSEVFQDADTAFDFPIAAASLGQVRETKRKHKVIAYRVARSKEAMPPGREGVRWSAVSLVLHGVIIDKVTLFAAVTIRAISNEWQFSLGATGYRKYYIYQSISRVSSRHIAGAAVAAASTAAAPREASPPVSDLCTANQQLCVAVLPRPLPL